MLEKQLKSEQDLQVWEKAFGPAWWGYGTYQQFLLPGQDMSGTRARPEPAATAGPAAGPAKHTQGSQATDSPHSPQNPTATVLRAARQKTDSNSNTDVG